MVRPDGEELLLKIVPPHEVHECAQVGGRQLRPLLLCAAEVVDGGFREKKAEKKEERNLCQRRHVECCGRAAASEDAITATGRDDIQSRRCLPYIKSDFEGRESHLWPNEPSTDHPE